MHLVIAFNDILVVKHRPVKEPTRSKSTVVGGTVDKFCKPPSVEEYVPMTQIGVKLSNKIQTIFTTQKREERRSRACEYMC